MQLYVKTGCPFCAKAIAVLDTYGLSYEEKNVSDPAITAELIALGGKKQEPFLVDGETMMYESENIVAYIETKHGGGGGENKPRVHFAQGTDVCPS
jgi:glutaredoxin 3